MQCLHTGGRRKKNLFKCMFSFAAFLEILLRFWLNLNGNSTTVGQSVSPWNNDNHIDVKGFWDTFQLFQNSWEYESYLLFSYSTMAHWSYCSLKIEKKVWMHDYLTKFILTLPFTTNDIFCSSLYSELLMYVTIIYLHHILVYCTVSLHLGICCISFIPLLQQSI